MLYRKYPTLNENGARQRTKARAFQTLCGFPSVPASVSPPARLDEEIAGLSGGAPVVRQRAPRVAGAPDGSLAVRRSGGAGRAVSWPVSTRRDALGFAAPQ